MPVLADDDTASGAPAEVLGIVALCPLLAVSDTIANALTSALAMLVVTLVSTMIAALLPRWLQGEMRFAALTLIVTTVVTAIALFTNAWLPHVYESLGVFLLLIVSNVLLLVQAQASSSAPSVALRRASLAALVVFLAMLTLGIARELVGRGSLLRDSADMFGQWAAGLHLQLFPEDMGFLLAVLPPGAFISLGLLFAVANWWRTRHAR